MKIKRIFGIGTAIAYIVIFLFIASMIYPFPSHQIKIREGGSYHYYSEGNLTAGSYINIENKGPYPVSDLVLSYQILNGTYGLSSDKLYLGNAVGNKTLNISFKIDVNKILNVPELNYLIFYPANLTLKLNLTGNYAYGFVKFLLRGNVTIGWDALARYSVGQIYVTQNSTNFSVHVPFQFGSAPFLSGNVTLLSKMVLNGTVLKEARTVLPLGTNYSTEIIFNFPISYENYLQQNAQYIKLYNYVIIKNNTIALGVIQ
ncbi:MAG: hypothetical protein JHC29_01135 [Thermoplasmata archaeon]|jgi:hypothetical protein|nr:hypothetical protein [Thermoplasmata archaeon]